jgi:hypothetical protein
MALFRNLDLKSGYTFAVKGSTSSFGQSTVNLAINWKEVKDVAKFGCLYSLVWKAQIVQSASRDGGTSTPC